MNSAFSRVGIVGVGLIGGSFGCAVKHFFPHVEVVGVDQDARALERAVKRKAIDSGRQEIKFLKGCDLIVLATPIQHIVTLLSQLGDVVNPQTIVTDTGSTKRAICEEAKKHLPENFIGGHPLAGSERQGIGGAHPFMFENALYVLTPFDGHQASVKKLSEFLSRLGAEVISIEPEIHDRVAAFVSHLPQLVAVSLSQTVANQAKKNQLFRQLAAGGFRDLTRIASSPFDIWKDILATNRHEIANCLDEFIQALSKIRADLEGPQVQEAFREAQTFREGLPVRSKGFLKKLHRLSALVPDRLGVLSEITSALAAEKISLKDIELLKTREYDAGTFHFYFGNEQEVAAAANALRRIGFECEEVND